MTAFDPERTFGVPANHANMGDDGSSAGRGDVSRNRVIRLDVAVAFVSLAMIVVLGLLQADLIESRTAAYAFATVVVAWALVATFAPARLDDALAKPVGNDTGGSSSALALNVWSGVLLVPSIIMVVDATIREPSRLFPVVLVIGASISLCRMLRRRGLSWPCACALAMTLVVWPLYAVTLL